MVEVNGNTYTITKEDENSFSLGVNSTGFTLYTPGGIGEWITNDVSYYMPGSRYAWNRFYSTNYGQYISFRMYYDDNLMNVKETHQTGFEMNAMNIWLRPAGRITI